MQCNKNYIKNLLYTLYSLPQPQFPKVDLYSKVLLDAVIMAIVTYSIVMSMGMMFAGYNKLIN